MVMQKVHPSASLPLNKIHGPGHLSLKRKFGRKTSQREMGDGVGLRAIPKQKGPARSAVSS